MGVMQRHGTYLDGQGIENPCKLLHHVGDCGNEVVMFFQEEIDFGQKFLATLRENWGSKGAGVGAGSVSIWAFLHHHGV